jgi:hypothetical protein
MLFAACLAYAFSVDNGIEAQAQGFSNLGFLSMSLTGKWRACMFVVTDDVPVM